MDYTSEFQILASRSDWPDAPLADTFLHDLADHVKDLLITYDRPSLLDGVVELVIQVNLQRQARGHSRQPSSPLLVEGSQGFLPPPSPLQLPPKAAAPKEGI